MLVSQPRQQRVVRHAAEYPTKALLGHAETEPLFEDLTRLFEHEHLQTLTHVADVRGRVLKRQGTLANDEQVMRGQVGVGCHRLVSYPHPVQEPGRLALRIEKGDGGGA